MPSYRRLQQFAIAISVVSVLYNGAEGGISVAFGAESSSKSLIVFGLQSSIEVLSAIVVLWRFSKVAAPGEEALVTPSPQSIRTERIATILISILLITLALGTEAITIFALVKHLEPEHNNSTLIISASALVLMILIWLPKNGLARDLKSSAMQGEARCSLACIQMTAVLFAGAIVFRFWKAGWWIDSAASLVLGLLFGWEGVKMLRWVMNPAFDGGCCDRDHDKDISEGHGLSVHYQDLCPCCAEKDGCKSSKECKCQPDGPHGELACCTPIDASGVQCCTHQTSSRRRVALAEQDEELAVDNQASERITLEIRNWVSDVKPVQQSCRSASCCPSEVV